MLSLILLALIAPLKSYLTLIKVDESKGEMFMVTGTE